MPAWVGFFPPRAVSFLVLVALLAAQASWWFAHLCCLSVITYFVPHMPEAESCNEGHVYPSEWGWYSEGSLHTGFPQSKALWLPQPTPSDDPSHGQRCAWKCGGGAFK